MNNKHLYTSLATLILAVLTMSFLSSGNFRMEPVQKGKSPLRLEQNTMFPSEGNGQGTGNHIKKSPDDSPLSITWNEMGPDNICGRIRCLVVDNSNSSLLIAGSSGGGIWKSTTAGLSWVKTNPGDNLDNLQVVSMCQTSNGDIYAGTGEYWASNSTRGFHGAGIFKSTDHGNTWALLSSTWNSSDDSKNIFYYVTKLAVIPGNNNKLFAATAKGLQITNDGGATWTNPIPSSDVNFNKVCTDVKVSDDGNIVLISLNNNAYVSNDGGSTFTNNSGSLSTQISTAVGRLEFAISAANSSYVYCLAADATGALNNVYQSTNKGQTWTKLLSGPNSQFQPFGAGKQGIYSNVIAVFPDDKQHLILGGNDLFSWTPMQPWEQISTSLSSLYSFVHSGIHCIVFPSNYSITNPDIYVTTDDGIFRSEDGGITWKRLYKNLNTVQAYSVSFSGSGALIAGTRNNGTISLPQNLTTSMDAVKIFSGDAGHCEYSLLNPNFIYTTTSYGNLYRSGDAGMSFSAAADMYTATLTNAVSGIGTDTLHPLVTPIRLYESFYDTNSIQKIRVIAPKALFSGDTLDAVSPCQRINKHIVTTADLTTPSPYGGDTLFKKGDTLYVKDTYQSLLAVGFNGSVWLSHEVWDLSKAPPDWYRPSNIPMNQIQTMEFSPDGDILYFADYSKTGDTSRVYRYSNLTHGRDFTSGHFSSTGNVVAKQVLGTFPHKITSIGVDPSHAGKVIVTTGGYSNSTHVYYSTNADTSHSALMTDNFSLKQGNLPAIPVYSSVILWKDSNVVILGTENGMYATQDISSSQPSWTEQNTNGMAHVPVLQLRQQIKRNGWLPVPGIVYGGLNTNITNHGYVYGATYGRGIFMTDDFKGPVSIPSISADNKSSHLTVFPNPAHETASVKFAKNKKGEVKLVLMDLNGNVIREHVYYNVAAGQQTLSIPVTGISQGTYVIYIDTEGIRTGTKLVIN